MTRARLATLLVLLAGAAVGAVAMASYHGVPGDFRRYHRAGRLVATGLSDRLYDEAYRAEMRVYEDERAEEKGAGGKDPFPEEEFKYLPATAVLMAPLGSLRLYVAKPLWGAWNGFLIALLFLVCGRASSGGRSAWWTLVPAALLANLVDNNIELGQLNASSLVPATLGMVCLARRKDVLAGALVGLGAVVKFMPVFLGLWFLWKRRFVAFGVLVLALAAIGWGLPAIALGPERATRLAKQFFEVRSEPFTDAKAGDVSGQSIKAFAYRTLWSPGPGAPDPTPRLRVAALPSDVVWWLVIALDVLVVGAVFRASRGALCPPDDRDGMLEAGAVLAVLPIVSPEARAPHFLVLALALTALTYTFADAKRGGAPVSRRVRLAFWLAVAGSLLLNTVPRTYVRKALSNVFADACALGWAAGLIVVACLLARRARAPEGPRPLP